jgi:hypothetical protein
MADTQNTSPGMLTAAAQVAAERYGVIELTGDRAVLIAALHTVINWLIDHPGIPLVNQIELRAHPRDRELDAADLVQLAAQIDGRVSSGKTHQWTEAPIPLGADAGGLQVRYTAFGRDLDQRR